MAKQRDPIKLAEIERDQKLRAAGKSRDTNLDAIENDRKSARADAKKKRAQLQIDQRQEEQAAEDKRDRDVEALDDEARATKTARKQADADRRRSEEEAYAARRDFHHQRLRNIQDEAGARKVALRAHREDALAATATAIGAIDDETRAHEAASRAHLQGIDEAQRAAQQGHDATLEVIEDEKPADDDAHQATLLAIQDEGDAEQKRHDEIVAAIQHQADIERPRHRQGMDLTPGGGGNTAQMVAADVQPRSKAQAATMHPANQRQTEDQEEALHQQRPDVQVHARAQQDQIDKQARLIDEARRREIEGERERFEAVQDGLSTQRATEQNAVYAFEQAQLKRAKAAQDALEIEIGAIEEQARADEKATEAATRHEQDRYKQEQLDTSATHKLAAHMLDEQRAREDAGLADRRVAVNDSYQAERDQIWTTYMGHRRQRAVEQVLNQLERTMRGRLPLNLPSDPGDGLFAQLDHELEKRNTMLDEDAKRVHETYAAEQASIRATYNGSGDGGEAPGIITALKDAQAATTRTLWARVTSGRASARLSSSKTPAKILDDFNHIAGGRQLRTTGNSSTRVTFRRLLLQGPVPSMADPLAVFVPLELSGTVTITPQPPHEVDLTVVAGLAQSLGGTRLAKRELRALRDALIAMGTAVARPDPRPALPAWTIADLLECLAASIVLLAVAGYRIVPIVLGFGWVLLQAVHWLPLQTAISSPAATPIPVLAPVVIPTIATIQSTPVPSATPVPATATPQPAPTQSPVATQPRAEPTWLSLLPQIDALAGRDPPRAIALLNAFINLFPEFAPAVTRRDSMRLDYLDWLHTQTAALAAAAEEAAARAATAPDAAARAVAATDAAESAAAAKATGAQAAALTERIRAENVTAGPRVGVPTPQPAAVWHATMNELESLWDEDWDVLTQILDAFLIQYPDFVAAKEELYAGAIEHAKQLIDEDNPDEADKLLQRMASLEDKDWDVFTKMLDAFLIRNPDFVAQEKLYDALIEHAKQLKGEHPDEADKLLQRAHELFPDRPVVTMLTPTPAPTDTPAPTNTPRPVQQQVPRVVVPTATPPRPTPVPTTAPRVLSVKLTPVPPPTRSTR